MVQAGKPFNFRRKIPESLVLYKPVEQDGYDAAILGGRLGGEPVMSTFKANGWRVLIPITPGVSGSSRPEIRMFTDGGHKRVDQYLPHVVAELQSLTPPPLTFLVGEALVEHGGLERLGAVAGILQLGSAEQAIARQERDGRVKLILHGALCWHDEWLSNTPFDEVLPRLMGFAPPNRGTWVKSLKFERGTVADIQRRVVQENREGAVFYRHDYKYTWLVGDPQADSPRPDGAYKWKPRLTGDFIADAPVMSSKRAGRIKDVMLMQLDPATRSLFNCGRLGNFTAAVDAELQRHGFPVALEVRYDGRHPSGKLVAPKFMRIRADKKRAQCVASQSYSEAQFL